MKDKNKFFEFNRVMFILDGLKDLYNKNKIEEIQKELKILADEAFGEIVLR